MLWFAFGTWNTSYGRWFVRQRIWISGYIWTPFVWVRLRRPTTVVADKATAEKECIGPNGWCEYHQIYHRIW